MGTCPCTALSSTRIYVLLRLFLWNTYLPADAGWYPKRAQSHAHKNEFTAYVRHIEAGIPPARNTKNRFVVPLSSLIIPYAGSKSAHFPGNALSRPTETHLDRRCRDSALASDAREVYKSGRGGLSRRHTRIHIHSPHASS